MQERETQSAGLRPWLLAAIAAAAVLLRLIGLRYGLPSVFNADEPHHVNMAVSFGGGSLNPGIFKYPTLWMYLLFGSYGAFFVGWSGFGLLRSVAEFGQLFVWDPGTFYLIARLLSAGLSAAGLALLYLCGRRYSGPTGLWAAALLAVSPTLVVSAHAAKPDSLMFLLAALAWWAAVRHRQEGRRRDLLLCAAAVGLCTSSQYIAAPLAALVFAAWWSGPRRDARALWAALALIPLGFLAGTPFALLDAPTFWKGVQDVRSMANVGSPNPWTVLKNTFDFAGHGIAGAGLLASALALVLRDPDRRKEAALLLFPIGAQLVFLGIYPNGTWHRFLIPVFPGLALLTALAAEAFFEFLPKAPKRLVALAAAAALLAPGAWRSWAFDRDLLLSDTRNQAASWIEENLPPGTRVLTFNEHASPRMRMSAAQARRLLERTRAAGHPRARYYELMVRSHPGKGYDILRIAQDPAVLQAPAGQVAWSAAGRDVLDIRPGLRTARDAGAGIVVFSSHGSSGPGLDALRPFFDEAEAQGRLLKEFRPEAGKSRGPVIRIIDISANARRTESK